MKYHSEQSEGCTLVKLTEWDTDVFILWFHYIHCEEAEDMSNIFGVMLGGEKKENIWSKLPSQR